MVCLSVTFSLLDRHLYPVCLSTLSLCLCGVIFYFHLKSKVDNILTKSTTIRINLNIYDTPIVSPQNTLGSEEPGWCHTVSDDIYF